MRVDVYLKRVCLFKSRSQVQKQCAEGLLTVDGRSSKASREVREGTRVGFAKGSARWEIRICSLPDKGVSRRDSHSFYEIVRQSSGDHGD